MTTYLAFLAVAVAADFDSVMDQARFFLEREQLADAQEQLEVAVTTLPGSRDAETWFLLAKIHYERGQLDAATEAANRARIFSRTPSELSQTQELYAFFQGRFGMMTIAGPEGQRTAVDLQQTSNQLDPELKAYVSRWRTRLADDEVALPFSLGVPVGSYAVNGQSVDIEAGETTVVEGAVVDASGFDALTIDLSAGGLGWATDQPLLASGLAELAVTVPFRGWIAGLVGQVTAQRFGEEVVETGIGGSVGLRAGRRFRIGHPWVLIPALDLRAGRVPGVDSSALFVGPQVQASYRRTAHWSVGFTIAGERVVGSFPANPDGGFGAWMWRLSTSVGYRR